jgi:hypothetical protein
MNPTTNLMPIVFPRAFSILALATCLVMAPCAGAAELVYARDGSGVFGYKHTPVLPWCGYHVHDPDRPEPPRIDPGPPPPRAPIPGDAIVLFDGGDLSAWEPNQWRVVDGEIEAGEGHLVLPEYRRKVSTGPVMLLSHDCPVRFRSIWVRPLDSP